MRDFRVRGEEWQVWQVWRPTTVPRLFSNEFRDGWLCFEKVGSGTRWRLPTAEAPSDWDELSDIRLRQLLLVARDAKSTGVTTRTVSQRRRELEDKARSTPR
jgi:hypothetical protein